MALFPGPPEDVVDAAIAVQREVRSLNEIRAGTGPSTIRVGVGLHRGVLMLGTIGEAERYDTKVIAGVVNVAARLESLTKVYDVEILASGAVVSAIKKAGAYHIFSLGSVPIVGLAKAMTAFEIRDSLMEHRLI